MDQRPYPGPPPLFHIRMSSLFVLLWTADCLMFLIATEHTLTNGVGGMVLFASEVSKSTVSQVRPPLTYIFSQYAILMASALNTIAKYVLSLYELRRAGRRGGENAPPWENKSMWFFYIELATGKTHRHRIIRAVEHKFCRLLKINHLPCLLRGDHNVLWFAAQHYSRCLHHRPVIHYPSSCLASISNSHPEYGPEVSKRDYGRIDGNV